MLKVDNLKCCTKAHCLEWLVSADTAPQTALRLPSLAHNSSLLLLLLLLLLPCVHGYICTLAGGWYRMVPAEDGGVMWPYYHCCDCLNPSCKRHKPDGCGQGTDEGSR
jgi:hypothetical protein